MSITRRNSKSRSNSHSRARRARKAPTSLSLRIDLVRRAKSLDLDLLDIVETALEEAILNAERARWLAENKEAIDYYNAFVETHGLFGNEFPDDEGR